MFTGRMFYVYRENVCCKKGGSLQRGGLMELMAY